MQTVIFKYEQYIWKRSVITILSLPPLPRRSRQQLWQRGRAPDVAGISYGRGGRAPDIAGSSYDSGGRAPDVAGSSYDSGGRAPDVAGCRQHN